MPDDDRNAAALIKLFTDACLSVRGNSDSIRAFAAKSGFKTIDDWGLLPALVGDGDNGIAWTAKVAGENGRFALSIRGGSGVCAVWAETAAPTNLETQFRDLAEGLARDSVVVTVEREELIPTRTGEGALVTYRVADGAAQRHFLLSLVVGDKTGSLFNGAPFQATVQFASASPPE